MFDIPTNDYHNELYGYLEREKKEKLEALSRDKTWKNDKNGMVEKVSLAKYIRNSIHHPENTKNKAFSQAELKQSIDVLRGIL